MGKGAQNRADTALKDDDGYIGVRAGQKSRHGAKNKPKDGWRIEDHVCRVCFSRILSVTNPEGGRTYRCAGCGVEANGSSPSVVCACGLKFKNGRNVGVRCVINESPSPEAPAQVVARQVVT